MNSTAEIPEEAVARFQAALLNQPDFGSLLTCIRLVNGMSRLELAAKAGMSISHVGQLERGRQYPSPRTLKKFIELFGLAPAYRAEFLRLAGEAQVQIKSAEQQRKVSPVLPPLSGEEKELFAPLIHKLKEAGWSPTK